MELQADLLIGRKEVVGFVFILCFAKQRFSRIAMNDRLLLQEICREEISPIAQQSPFEAGLHEQHLRDLVEGSGRIEVFAITNDVVTLVEKVGEFVLFEDLQLLDQLFDLFVTRVRFRDVGKFPPDILASSPS